MDTERLAPADGRSCIAAGLRWLSAVPRLGRLTYPLYRRMAEQNGVRVRVNDHTLHFLARSEPPLIPPLTYAAASDYRFVRHFCAAVRPGAHVADIGAYHGTYTLPAALLTGPAGHVTAFEPFAPSRDVLLANLQANRLADRVTISGDAASDADGIADFYSAGGDSMNSLAFAGLTQDGRRRLRAVSTTTTSTVTLDRYFDGKRPPDLVKIDVEGAEFRVLRGMQRILATDTIVFCELHPYAWRNEGHTGDNLRSWLAARGRTMLNMDTDRPFTDYRYGVAVLGRATLGHSTG